MFQERNDDWLQGVLPAEAPLVGVGLGGICEGWLPNVLLYMQAGVLPLKRVILVDGKKFSAHNHGRQNFRNEANKAEERKVMWGAMYPTLPIYAVGQFVDEHNIAQFIPEGTVVLLSPDNHPTRALFARHVSTLNNALLICGGNDGINKEGGEDGTQGWAAIYCRRAGMNVTAPLTTYHPEIAEASEKMPSVMSCMELAQAGQPQLLATNLHVGQIMAYLLHRYLTMPLGQALEVVEQ
ncbi:MAG: hypothetical protein U1C49_03055 [Candidatus Andersenbacteria bacterium]|nr:hypothetical protein [Candidatus Andersenbacteria bacterium]